MNKIKILLMSAMLSTFTPGCVSQAPSSTTVATFPNRTPASLRSSLRRERRRNSLLLKLREDATPEQLEALNALYQQVDIRHEKYLLNKKAARLIIHGPYHQDQEEEVAEQIMATGAVQFAEPDYVVPMATAPNDPYYISQWHHEKIGSELAWRYTIGKNTIPVALCDSGFDLNHPDLASQFILPGYNTVKENSEINGINGHGTMTSGMIAAIGNNGIGIAGMAWNVRLLPIQITDRADGSSTDSDIVECIRYASDHGAKVVNISYDGTYTSAAINEAAAYMRAAGGLVVVAAGNGGTDISSWGPSPNLLVVGATNFIDQPAGFTNFGTPVDLVAPGVDVYTTLVGGNYDYESGTSFSSPIVAGTAGLIYSLNPSWTPAQVEHFLLATAKDLGTRGADPTYAGGRLEAGAAVEMAATAIADMKPPVLTITSPTNNASVAGSITVAVTASDNFGVASVAYYVDTNPVGTVSEAPFSFSLNTTTLTNGSHSLSAKAKDFGGNSSISTISLNVNNSIGIKSQIVLDNLPAGVSDATRSFTGKWCKSQLTGSYQNTSLNSCGRQTDTYRFTPSIPTGRAYKISLRYLSKTNFGSKVPVKIHSAAGTQTKQVNMQKGGGVWWPLGVYNLGAGKGNYVELSSSNGGSNIDGVMFEPQ